MRSFITNSKGKTAGFTLVELLVVLSIFVIVSSLILFDYNGLRSGASLNNLSADISLSIRRAQSYAIGAYSSSSNFNYGYGVHFSTDHAVVGSNPQNGSNKSFVLFTDVSGNKLYDLNPIGIPCKQANLSATSECSELLSITTPDEISALYINGSATPVPAGGVVDIMFLRPNPDAYFCYRANPNSTSCDSSTTISNVRIEISSLNKARGYPTKSITVWNTGQISSN